MAEPPRRFPPPWRVVEHPELFWVQDAGGQTVVRAAGVLRLSELAYSRALADSGHMAA